jgi:GMP synthase (glutamine-hydrolysing)
MLVIQHEPGEGLGALSRFLGEPRIVRTYAGDPIPQDPDALVVLGGGMCVRDQDRLPHLREEIRLLQRCVSLGRPVLGICLGSQLLAAALGAQVEVAPAKEIGFYRVRLTPQARLDPLLAGAPEDFVAFHWHGDAFALPEGAAPLAASTLTPLQAFRFGERAWGIQFHLEIDEALLRSMVASGETELAENGVDAELLVLQARRELPRIEEIAAAVFSRWMRLTRSGSCG